MKRMKSLLFALLVLALIPAMLPAQGYKYTLSWNNPQSHVYKISMEVKAAAGSSTDFQIPAWRPGRYYIQDYAASVSGFTAQDPVGDGLDWKKVDNNTWRVTNPASGPIIVEYYCYANTMDAGSSVLNAEEAYFNPVNIFMHVRDRYAEPCTLTVASMPDTWKSATALGKVFGKHNMFTAADYHDFVDSPTILSPTIKTLHSRIEQTDFYFHFQGEFPDDKATEDAFQSNMGKIIREQSAIFGGFPMKEYHFIYHLVPFNIGHAVEHKYSASFALPNSVAKSPAAIARLNSISSHEFFHLWNVKRIRPAVMWPYDYQEEAHTTLHWFTEGVTDYYTSLAMERAGLYARKTYYNILTRTVASLENNYASKVTSPSKSSFDSWLDRSDYFAPYHRISYYTLGSRVGLLMDLEIRGQSAGKLSLDDLFRKLWTDFFEKDKGVGEDDIAKTLKAMTGNDWYGWFDKYVHGTASPDYAALVAPFGLEWIEKPQTGLGLELTGIGRSESTDYGLFLQSVTPGTDADRSGLGAEDLIVDINGAKATEFDAIEFFSKNKAPQVLKIKVLRNGTAKDMNLNWTGKHHPKTYAIKEMKKPSKEQAAMLEGWLGSKL